MAKKTYLVLISRGEDGTLHRRPVPLQFAYALGAAALVGLFTVAGLAGSYSRMLLKTERFNQLRREHDTLRGDYARLEKREHEKEVQAASLGALASEVSALYGFTARGAQGGVQFIGRSLHHGASAGVQPSAQLADTSTDNGFSNATYYKSLSDFYALRGRALDGSATRAITGGLGTSALVPDFESGLATGNLPSLWPVTGPITSPFGGREDPILGAGEGEFHKGVDIAAPSGTPIRATASGVVLTAAMGNGYGREVVLDHGGGVHTVYGHMSGFHCTAGDQVVRGQIIGYVGTTGRSTGPHVHYEVRLRDVPVNPHKYLRMTADELGTAIASR